MRNVKNAVVRPDDHPQRSLVVHFCRQLCFLLSNNLIECFIHGICQGRSAAKAGEQGADKDQGRFHEGLHYLDVWIGASVYQSL